MVSRIGRRVRRGLAPILLAIGSLDVLASAGLAQGGGNATAPLESPVDPGGPLASLGLALAATLVLGLAVWIVQYAHRWARTRTDRIGTDGEKELTVGSIQIRSTWWIRRGLQALLGVTRIAAVLTLLAVYVPLLFSLFDPTQHLVDRLLGLTQRNLDTFAAGIRSYLPDLVFIVLVSLITWAVLKLLKVGFREIYEGRISVRGFYPSWARPTYAIVRVLVLAFVLVLILPRLPGFGSAAFEGVSLFLGALVALGASSAMANVISGTVLTYTRAFSIGDRVQIADTVGDVVERTLLITRVRTRKNEDVTIPNSQVLANHIINYSSNPTDRPLIISTEVSIGYDVPWRRVADFLVEAADPVEGLLDEPEPFVLQRELGDHAVTYELNVHTDQPAGLARLQSDLNARIRDVFAAAGVDILSPIHNVFREPAQAPPAPQTSPPEPEDRQADEPDTAAAPSTSETSPEEQAELDRARQEAAADAAAEEAWAEQEAEEAREGSPDEPADGDEEDRPDEEPP